MNRPESDILKAVKAAAAVFHVNPEEISGISPLKNGMTNESFLFHVHGKKYIIRIPGEGTDRLINRAQEAAVYQVISGHSLCDDPIYINSESGYKITRYLEGARVCDAGSEKDLKKAVKKLVELHRLHLTVPYTFELFKQIEFYENLWEGSASVYQDYAETKKNVFSLREYIEKTEKDWCLTHIDAVPDNFLFYETQEGEQVQLIDWEYSGMQDPHVDIAMFCIYSLYNKQQADRLIDLYFEEAGGTCGADVRFKIYAYISICGLLWSNWCEFKSRLGIEFGEYSLRQYQFAKDYYQYAMEEMRKKQDDG